MKPSHLILRQSQRISRRRLRVRVRGRVVALTVQPSAQAAEAARLAPTAAVAAVAAALGIEHWYQ